MKWILIAAAINGAIIVGYVLYKAFSKDNDYNDNEPWAI